MKSYFSWAVSIKRNTSDFTSLISFNHFVDNLATFEWPLDFRYDIVPLKRNFDIIDHLSDFGCRRARYTPKCHRSSDQYRYLVELTSAALRSRILYVAQTFKVLRYRTSSESCFFESSIIASLDTVLKMIEILVLRIIPEC